MTENVNEHTQGHLLIKRDALIGLGTVHRQKQA